MSKLKIEHGASRIKRGKLQATVDQSVLDDLMLYAEWSNNELNYVASELLKFALMQDEDFVKYRDDTAAKLTKHAPQNKSTSEASAAIAGRQ